MGTKIKKRMVWKPIKKSHLGGKNDMDVVYNESSASITQC